MDPAVNPFLPLSVIWSITGLVVSVLLLTHAAIALAIVRGFAGNDGDPRSAGKRFFLQVTLVCGGLLLATAPATLALLAPAGLGTRTWVALEAGLVSLVPGLVWIWRELADPTVGSGRRFWHIVGSFAIATAFLVTTKLVHQDETRHAWLVANPPPPAEVVVAAATALNTLPPEPATTGAPAASTPAATPPTAATPATATPAAAESDPQLVHGEQIFKTRCAICHLVDRRLIGPPIQEIATIYAGNPAGIAAWAKAPGKKRADYPPMIPVILPDEDLTAAGAYMLKIGAKKP
jgi:cytochrome c